MADKTSTSNPLVDAWFSAQEQYFRAQQDWMKAGSEIAQTLESSDMVQQAKENWRQCEQQFESWMTVVENWLPASTDMEGVSAETLRRMLEPGNFLKSGLDEINHAFQKLVDSPDFADIGVLEKKFLKTGNDWLAMRDASAEYQAVIMQAWSKAFEIYSDETLSSEADGGEKQAENTRDLLNRWLKIANDQLVAAQRSDEFLSAQRKLVSAAANYRKKQSELAELWCEAHAMPTRTEIDDLHKLVYSLRREVRELKRELRDLSKPEPVAKQPATTKKKTGKKVTSRKRKTTTRKTAKK